jgi:hypothetical protein
MTVIGICTLTGLCIFKGWGREIVVVKGVLSCSSLHMLEYEYYESQTLAKQLRAKGNRMDPNLKEKKDDHVARSVFLGVLGALCPPSQFNKVSLGPAKT